MAQEKFGDMDVGVLDMDRVKELSGDEIKEMWDQAARLQWDCPYEKWNNEKQRRIKR